MQIEPILCTIRERDRESGSEIANPKGRQCRRSEIRTRRHAGRNEMLKKLHHVAYRCADAQKTVDFYTRMLGLKFAHALSNDRVPSTQAWSPHLHIFFEMEDGSYIAFFEVPCSPAAQKDPNTPDWVQHLALEVESEQILLDTKKKLEAAGVKVVGVTDHEFCE